MCVCVLHGIPVCVHVFYAIMYKYVYVYVCISSLHDVCVLG